jgi:hypothetical protein
MRLGLLMARRRTTRRKTTTRRRRSPKPMLNVANAAQTLIVANAATTAFFGVRLDNFLLDGWARPMQGNTNPGSYAGGSNNSWELSLAELVKGVIPGGQGFGITNSLGLMGNIKRNLQTTQGQQALATMVFAPIAFKVGKKVLAKPLINPVNKGLKQLGLASVVKV